MTQPYIMSDAGCEFDEARSSFEAIEQWLASDDCAACTHEEVERGLEERSRELMRLLLQGHLDLRGHREERRTAVRGADDVERTHVRPGDRPLGTVFGPCRVPRLRYGTRRADALAPADAVLNLPVEMHSHGLRRHAAIESARGSFDEAVEALARYTGGGVAKRQVEHLAQRTAEDFDAFYEQREADGIEETDDLLVLSTDGKGIVMRTEDLRPETRRKALRARHKLKKRLSAGEKLGRKRMATVAAVYSILAEPRLPIDVIRELAPVRDTSKPRPRAYNKRVWASVEKDSEDVIDAAFREAHRRDPDKRRTWVVLVDGDANQLDRVSRCADRHDVGVVTIVDFIHVLEYLWRAAWAFHAKADPAAEHWVTQRALRILEGRVSDVAAGIRRSATLQGLTGNKRQAVDKAVDYLLNHREMLRYDIALAQGWPIATGVIEGACRHLVKDRMDITGARWGLRGAEAVLKLRSLRSSADWGEYWRFHMRREQERNHLSRYAASEWRAAA